MKQALTIFTYALAAIAVIGTLIPLLPAEGWYVRMFDFPRLQLLFLAVISLALCFFLGLRYRLRNKALLVLLAATLIYQSINIFPYTFLSPVQTKKSDRSTADTTQVSVLVANVLMTNRSYSGLIALIRQYEPDVLLALESDAGWQEGLGEVTQAYPYRVEVPLDNTYGMHLYSKLPLRQKQVNYMLDDGVPSVRTYMQLRNGTWVEFWGVHPKPPVPTEEEDSRKRDAEIIIVGKKVANSKYPVIVAGDFNDVAWSPTTRLFQEVSQLLDPRVGRGFFSTYHAHYPIFRWPLDHLFHSNHFRLVEMERLGGINSDHFPIFIRLSYEPDEKYEQVPPAPDEETHEEAVETIEEGMHEAQQEGKQPDTLTTK
ncbi:endonuclease/exonuclease/phosphatase family protein [Pontibacter litorisediminis]|uniref:endonuclease/exonuclease/phosphatase family protein n=1 Tax=Pontibacter litorisediminis TaxID=1846260 RepID=UPI0023EC9262|nr:endonuclease/exonuclease/phosphatase family protein [Pontibacter litorisediminis]